MDLLVIDGENCFNDKVRERVTQLRSTQTFVVLGKKQAIDKEYLKVMKVVKIKQHTKNAVDFVVVALVTQKLTAHKYTRAFILSNDTGFDAAIIYLVSIGFNVSRIGYNQFIANLESTKFDIKKESMMCYKCLRSDMESGTNISEVLDEIEDISGEENKYNIYSYLIQQELIKVKGSKVYI